MPRVPSAAAAHIGRRVADTRRRYTLTQDQLAVRADIDSSNLRSYESGRAMMNIQTLVRLADALDVEPGYLLEGLTLDLFGAAAERGRKAG
ncbi:helix-turn-helix domain-containing protein [Microbacterium fluvii]|uniref:Helix-turn-helix domain-containing protein n=1 Tax=Microbacterium fluvii TaxID=415215 RepID=A0ABW2HDU6_9MICO|nr:helix-turn-helix transcriptional regulator [Microbacterium fluvii]MCU4673135.1 helix-turn-helix domain-containing protein [Microbacterium fluvii]